MEATSSPRSSMLLSSSPSVAPRIRCEAIPTTAAAAASSPARRRARSVGSTDGSAVPRPPSVHTSRWTWQPALDHRASVPPHATSASSGWAYTASTDSGTPSTSSATSHHRSRDWSGHRHRGQPAFNSAASARSSLQEVPPRAGSRPAPRTPCRHWQSVHRRRHRES